MQEVAGVEEGYVRCCHAVYAQDTCEHVLLEATAGVIDTTYQQQACAQWASSRRFGLLRWQPRCLQLQTKRSSSAGTRPTSRYHRRYLWRLGLVLDYSSTEQAL